MESLTVLVIIDTQLLDRHVEEICRRKIRIQFTRGEIPIMDSGTKENPWSLEKNTKRYKGRKGKDTRTQDEGDESSTLTKLRTVCTCRVPAYNEVPINVRSSMGPNPHVTQSFSLNKIRGKDD